MRRSLFCVVLVVLSLVFSHVQAEEVAGTSYLSGSIGYFDITQDDDNAASLGLEYRFADKWWVLTPFVGAFATNDSAFYGYFGLGYDWQFTDNWYTFISSAVGGFHHGDGKDLGHGIEFRSGIELGYEFDNADRLGLGFHHLSNASIGDRNPGVEVLTLNYNIPF